jgi:hypothetical protein
MWPGIVTHSTLLRRSAFALLLGASTSMLVTAGCSGRSSRLDGPSVSDGEGGEGEPTPSAGRSGDAGRGGAGAPSDARDEPYVDPGCPDAAAVPGTIECDPFAQPSGCSAGFACKPSIEHPFGDGCDQQRFNMLCRPAGFGVQGAECSSANDCADGFLCVVGAGAGKLCLRMCPLDGTGACPSGYICGETDALGIGVCA